MPLKPFTAPCQAVFDAVAMQGGHRGHGGKGDHGGMMGGHRGGMGGMMGGEHQGHGRMGQPS